jgi:hypothetical protein
MQQEKNSNYTRVVPACRYNLGYMRERREKYMRILAVWLTNLCFTSHFNPNKSLAKKNNDQG